MRKHTVLGVLLLCAAASLADDTTTTRLEKLEERVEAILSKAGIHFSGEFRSRLLFSRIGGDGALDHQPTDEPVEFTSVDFDIVARPNDAIGGRAILRLHQDWRNFFSDISNPIFTRWISIDGTVKRMFSYHVGDLRECYSPLTLYTPEVDIAYEPEIFARLRRAAMDEEFLGDNQRVLQGVNVNLDAEVAPILDELHVSLLASRLRQAETSIANGSQVVTDLDSALMDKYLLGGNIDMTILPQLTLGGTFLDIMDAPSTAVVADTVADTMAQQTAIWAIRGGIGTKPFVKTDRFSVGLHAELAMSHDDTTWSWRDTVRTATDTTIERRLESDRIDGAAFSAGLDGAVRFGGAQLRLEAGYLYTAPQFRNELAQTPSFIGQRIMNIENDSMYRGPTFLSYQPSVFVETHYSTFDALYRDVFKFTPSEAASNLWVKAPRRKISYTNTILTQNELAAIERSWLDPAVQLAMPFGPATPNRTGIRGSLSLGMLENALDVSASLLAVEQIEGDSLLHVFSTSFDSGMVLPSGDTATADTMLADSVALELPATAYTKFGGGLAFDLGHFIMPGRRPLRLSFGYTFSSAVNDGASGWEATSSRTDVHFLNAGLYFNFWKRLSLLGGYQQIDARLETGGGNVLVKVQRNWAAGLEYRVGEGGTLTGTFGRMDVALDDEDPATTGDNDPSARDFHQWQTDLYLTVPF